jgi:hypothetical protein
MSASRGYGRIRDDWERQGHAVHTVAAVCAIQYFVLPLGLSTGAPPNMARA